MAAGIRHVTANSLDFAYLEAGEGPLVLLLHGFPDTAHTWDHVRPLIAAKGYRAVSPWTRGYAPTGIPERDTDLETMARDVLALIAALGETSAIVIGHDWGAIAAYAAAALEPARVKRIVSVAIPHTTAVRRTPAMLWKVRHFVEYKPRGAARKFAKDDFSGLARIYKRWSPAWTPDAAEFAPIRETFANQASLDAAFGYYRANKFRPQPFMRVPITVPTVVFSGNSDGIVKLADYQRAKRMFTSDYVIEEMSGGHFMHREYPDEFADKLLAHL